MWGGSDGESTTRAEHGSSVDKKTKSPLSHCQAPSESSWLVPSEAVPAQMLLRGQPGAAGLLEAWTSQCCVRLGDRIFLCPLPGGPFLSFLGGTAAQRLVAPHPAVGKSPTVPWASGVSEALAPEPLLLQDCVAIRLSAQG